MFNNRGVEFFEDATGRLSSARFVAIGAFFISSAVLCWLKSESAYLTYLGTWVSSYSLNKYNEGKTQIAINKE